MRFVRIALAATGVVLGVVAYRVRVDNLGPYTTDAKATAIVAAGLVAWARRPANRIGPLMTLAAFALLARQFRYSHDALAFTAFFLVSESSYAVVVHAVFAYPSGRVVDAAERALVRVGYAATLLFPLAILLV